MVGRHMFAAYGPEKSIATYKNNPIADGVYFDALTMGLADIVDPPDSISHAVVLLGDVKADSCARDVEKSQALNVRSIKSILEYLRQHAIKPVFTSSHWVFDGIKGGYTEEDEVSPILRYAMQKVEVEEYLQETFQEYLVARLAMVYGSQRGDDTVLTNWVKAIEQGRTSYCAYDSINCPIHVEDVVEALTRLMDTGSNGIFHVCSPKPFSRLQLYQTLLSHYGDRVPDGAQAVSCSFHDFETLEKRPLNVSMRPDKLLNATNVPIRDVESVCRELVGSAI